MTTQTYRALAIDGILDNEDFALQIRSDNDKTHWLNITREELLQIKKILTEDKF